MDRYAPFKLSQNVPEIQRGKIDPELWKKHLHNINNRLREDYKDNKQRKNNHLCKNFNRSIICVLKGKPSMLYK